MNYKKYELSQNKLVTSLISPSKNANNKNIAPLRCYIVVTLFNFKFVYYFLEGLPKRVNIFFL